MGLRSTLRHELGIAVEQALAERDPVPPGDVADLAARVAAYEVRVPSAEPVRAELTALVAVMGTFTRSLVPVRAACGQSLTDARAALAAAEAALTRAEAVASEDSP